MTQHISPEGQRRWNGVQWVANIQQAPAHMPQSRLSRWLPGIVTSAAIASTMLIVGISWSADDVGQNSPPPKPAAQSGPSAPSDPLASLEEALAEDLGDITRGDEGQALTSVSFDEDSRVLVVTFRMSDDLPGVDTLVGAAWADMKAITELVQAGDVPVQELRIAGTFAFTHRDGDVLPEKRAMTTSQSAETLARVDPQNLSDEGMRDAVDDVWIHPDLLS